MKYLIVVSLGELVLKGKNRGYFENKLMSSIKRVLKDIEIENIYKELGKVYIEANASDLELIEKRLKYVFGIVYITKALRCEKNLVDIKTAIKKVIEDMNLEKEWTFKIKTTRSDKNFPLTSLETNDELGRFVLSNYKNSKVDVHNPEHVIYVDIKENAYVYTHRIKATGGMPQGTNGEGLLLLSGGIDSPVAGFMMARRGLKVNAVHFHSYPFTSERSEKKMLELSEVLSRYNGSMKVFSVNILDIQKEVAKNCDEKYTTILSRVFMVKIAEKIAKKKQYDALIMGDNLGQVASQTIAGLKITDSVSDVLIFRPLIGMDKQNIIDIAKDIETYELSVLPYDDCCTVFAPKHPILNPTFESVEEQMIKINSKDLIEQAINSMKTFDIR